MQKKIVNGAGVDIKIETQPAIITVKQLGANCWVAARFCGGRCQRVMECNYPEKKTCLAVDSEIKFQEEQFRVTQEKHIQMVKQLKESQQ